MVAVPKRRIDPARWPAWSIIREARRRAGFTQAELAARAGTSQAEISRYERALVLPEIGTLIRIVEACGMHLELKLADRPDHEMLSSTALEQTVEERLSANDAYASLVSQLRSGLSP